MPRTIEHRQFPEGLRVENACGLLIRDCTITNASGHFGLELAGCRDVRVENCVIRRIGNETAMDRTQMRDGSEFFAQGVPVSGVALEDCHGITLVKNDITDIFGRGIRATARQGETALDLKIENNRLAYVLDDGIYLHTPGDQDSRVCATPLGGVSIVGNLLHDIGLGLTRLPFARHGMYLKCRDVLVEDNTIYNCFYGQAISLRNAGTIRGNRIRNCHGGIAYWAQTRTADSSRTVVIEANDIRQDFAFDFPMRHIDDPRGKRHGRPEFPGIVFQYSADPRLRLERFVIARNRITILPDYESPAPLITGNGAPEDCLFSMEIHENIFDDRRTAPRTFANLPPRNHASGTEIAPSG